MRLSTTLLSLSASASAALLPRQDLPKPSIANITYWGSACPDNGLAFAFSNANASTPNVPLTFTLANYLPNYGSFGSSLRMCNAVAFVAVEKGWKVKVNGRGTTVAGDAQLPGNSTLFFRSTYTFAESAGTQSVGMFDVPGPLAGPFSHLLTPVEGSDLGVVSGCAGGESELDIEFQARAVNDTYGMAGAMESNADARWTLTTDVEVVKC